MVPHDQMNAIEKLLDKTSSNQDTVRSAIVAAEHVREKARKRTLSVPSGVVVTALGVVEFDDEKIYYGKSFRFLPHTWGLVSYCVKRVRIAVYE